MVAFAYDDGIFGAQFVKVGKCGYTHALASVINEFKPEIFLIGATAIGMNFLFFLCSSRTITLVVSTVKRRVLIFFQYACFNGKCKFVFSWRMG